MRTKPKVYFLDPSIAVASLGITQAKLSSDYETLGFFFENLVIRDFSVYAQLINAKTFFYADLDNLEIDLILEFEDET
jgi:predicted AAA+ superfamily ATPase